jgi:hypothetical protein
MSTALWGERKARRITVLIRLHQKGPAEVFAELRWIQLQSGRKPGWVAHCFREIFGGWPRPRTTPEPTCPSDCAVEDWLLLRPKKKPRARMVSSTELK